MAAPKIPGRMIRRSIATDKGIAKMTAEETAVFCMILPHLDSYGKLIGEPPYVKEVALPFAPWATLEVIESALKATNKYTSVKWFRHKDGRRYLHAVQFERHQLLEKDKRGMDLLPSCPRRKSATKSTTKSASQSQDSRPRSRSELESKEKEKEELEFARPEGSTSASAPLGGQSAVPTSKGNGNGTATASGKGELPEYVSTILQHVSPDMRRSVESLYRDVTEGKLKAESARSALILGGVPSLHVDSLFPKAVIQ